MANKYEIRTQYEVEKSQRRTQAISNVINFATDTLGIANDIYQTADSIYKSNEQEKAQDVLDKVQQDLPLKLDELSYEWAEDPNTGEKKKVRMYSAQERYDNIMGYIGDKDFLVNNGYVTDDSSKYFTDYLTSGWKNLRSQYAVSQAETLVTESRDELKASVSTNVTNLINNAGTEGNQGTVVTRVKTSHENSDTAFPYTLEEVDTSSSQTAEEMARANMKEELSATKIALYDEYSKIYSPAEAQVMVAQAMPSVVLNMELNSAESEMYTLMKTDPNFDIKAYASDKTMALDGTDYDEFLDGYEFTASDRVSHYNDICTLQASVASRIQGEISGEIPRIFEKFSELNSGKLKSLDGTTTYLSEDYVKSELENFAQGLGFDSLDIMAQYMDSTTLNTVNTYLYYGAENDGLAEANELVAVLNGSNEEKKAYAEKNGIDYDSDADLDSKLIQAASINGQSHIYRNPYSSDIHYEVKSGTITTSSGSTKSSSSSPTTSSEYYVTPFGESIGARPEEVLIAEDKEEYSWDNYKADFNNLISNNRNLEFLKQAQTLATNPDFAEYFDYIAGGDTTGLEGEELEAYNAKREDYSALINFLASKGITSSSQLTPELVSKLIKEIETENNILSSNVSDYLGVLVDSGHYPTLTDKNSSEIAERARYLATSPTARVNENGNPVLDENGNQIYDNGGTGYDTVTFNEEARSYSIARKKATISNGEVVLQTAQTGIAALNTAKSLLITLDDEESRYYADSLGLKIDNSEILQAVINTAELSDPYLTSIFKEALGIESDQEIYWSSYSVEDIDTAIKQVENYMENISNRMVTADSALAKYAEERGETYTKTDANTFITNSQNSSFVTSMTNYLNASADTVLAKVEEYTKERRYDIKASIYRYELFGEEIGETGYFKSIKELLSKSEGREVSSEEVYQWMKEKDASTTKEYGEYYDGGSLRDYKSLVDVEYEQYCYDNLMAVNTYNPSASQPQTNPIDKSALQYMYRLYVGNDYEGKTIGELADAIIQSTDFGRTKGGTSYLISVEGEEVENTPQTTKERFMKEFRNVADSIYADTKNNSLPRLEGRNSKLYKQAETSVNDELARLEAEQKGALEIAQASIEEICSQFAIAAQNALNAGQTAEEARQTLETLNLDLRSDLRLTPEQLDNAVVVGQSLRKNENGICQFNLSQVNLGKLTNNQVVQDQLNRAIVTLCDGVDAGVVEAYSSNIASSLYALVLKTAESGDPKQIEDAIAGYVSNIKNIEDSANSMLFSKDGTKIETKEYKKGEGIGTLGIGLKWAKGEAISLPLAQIFESTGVQNDFDLLTTAILTDPSTDDLTTIKMCEGAAISWKEGSNTIDINDIEDSSYEDLTTRLVEPSDDKLADGYATAYADMMKVAADTLKSAIEYSSECQYLATIGKDANGNITETYLHFTASGPLIETKLINGQTVYMKANLDGDEITGFSFYKDKGCVKQIFNVGSEATVGMTNDQIEQLGMSSAMAKADADIKFGGVLTSETLGALYTYNDEDLTLHADKDKEAQKQEMLNTTYTFIGNNGEIQSATGAEIKKLASQGKIKLITDSTYNTPADVKKALELTNKYKQKQGCGSDMPPEGQMIAFHVADGTFQCKKADLISIKESEETEEGTLMAYNGKQYLLKDGKITPYATESLSNEKIREYRQMADSIVAKSNNSVTTSEALEAISYLMEGYDLAFTYLDKDGNYISYVPTAYSYIQKGYFLNGVSE